MVLVLTTSSRRLLLATRPDKGRNPDDSSGGKYLRARATHIDGELEGIALALETHNADKTGMLTILSDCRPAIRKWRSWTQEQQDLGHTSKPGSKAPLKHENPNNWKPK